MDDVFLMLWNKYASAVREIMIMRMIAWLLCDMVSCAAVVLWNQVVIGRYGAIEEVVEHFLGRFSTCIGCFGHRM